MMKSESLECQVTTTLGDHAADYDIAGIVTELRETYPRLADIDIIDTDDYWVIIARHESK